MKINIKKIIAPLVLLVLVIIVACWRLDFGMIGIKANQADSSPLLRLYFFDVGQGDSELIRTPDGTDILVDGGPDQSAVKKLGQYLPPNDRKIEYLILTHPHSDHVAGFPELLRRYQIGQIIMTGVVHTAPDYLEFLKLIKEKQIEVKVIDNPQELDIDNVKLQFLTPTSSLAEKTIDNLNNSSIVFKLMYGSSTVLYTGDYENEESLLAQSAVQLKSDLLKAGHHGSANANDKGFLQAVAPADAVICVGAGNSYELPSYRTIYYLENIGTRIWRTDVSGDVIFLSDGSSIWKKNK